MPESDEPLETPDRSWNDPRDDDEARRERTGQAPPSTTQGTRWSEGQYAARGMARMNLRLPVETMELLDDAAEEYGQSRCELIDEAVRAWLAK